MRSSSLISASVRTFAAHFCIVLHFLQLDESKASEWNGHSATQPTPSAQQHGSSDRMPPVNLRLQGVATIGDEATAYFIETTTGMVVGMRIGDSLPEGYTLVRIENGDDFRYCRAVIAHAGLHHHIGVEDFMQVTTKAPTSEAIEALESDAPVDRVAVRPWVDPSQGS